MSENNSGGITLALVLGAIVFVVAMAMLLIVGDYRFVAAFFVAVLLALLTAIVLYLAFNPAQGVALAGAATGAKPAAATPAAAAPEAKRKTDEDARARAEADAAAAKAEAEAKAAEEAAQVDAEAATKAAEEAAVPPAPAAQAAGTGEDYDGDGVLEGENEGSRPAGLYEARDGKPDDLKAIKGIGPKLEQLCNSLGFWHFDQVASWTDEEVAWVDANLKGFKGRVSRDNWVEQAKILASGGATEFSKRVDDGEVY